MLVAFSYLGGMCGGWNVWGGSANAGAACEVAKWSLRQRRYLSGHMSWCMWADPPWAKSWGRARQSRSLIAAGFRVC